MFKFIIFLMLLNSFSSIFTWHPLKMAIIVFIQTILTCWNMLIVTKSSWLPYILLLAFVGGLLILFSYMTIIASNEMIKMNSNTFFLYSMLIFMFIIVNMFSDKIMMMINLENLNFLRESYFNKNMLTMIKLFNNYSYIMNFILMNYLLITLIVSNKIINVFKGPLRKLN
uniref:NADH dehydrogenase subunit 6 n=1 Tax=Oxyethira ecornuta TaxID=1401674 RepID=UPI0022DCDF00|nr:NADH dehydrogenase subunit 6 [Oxyethira ecornuta]UZZ44244.1 NADH dehydrogenase subunit 6 [Oxyethira ecornuta]